MLDLTKLQEELEVWRDRNFPNADADQQLLGVVEEVGELAHANLKMKQEVRNSTEEDEEDAVGDMLIYLLGYCSYKQWDMGEILEHTAHHVMQRDWIKYPRNGRTE